MSTGFFGGLAQGIGSGVRLSNEIKTMNMQERKQERDEGRMQKWEAATEEAVQHLRTQGAQGAQPVAPVPVTVAPVAAGQQPIPKPMQPMAQQMPVGKAVTSTRRFAQGGLVQMPPMAAQPQVGGLPPPPQQQAQPPQQEQLRPSEELTKGMVTGAFSPENLTAMADIYAKHGFVKEGREYLEHAYTMQDRGITRGVQALMRNQVGAGMEQLKQGGIEFESPPTKVNDDPNDHTWSVHLKGGSGKQNVNLRDWMQSTMDPEKFMESRLKNDAHALDREKQGLEVRKHTDQHGLNRDEYVLKVEDQGLKGKKNAAEIRNLDAETGALGARARRDDRYEQGGGREERPEVIDRALNRRDKTIESLSSVRGEDGKFEVDPIKRGDYDLAANKSESMLERHFGRELTAREHHKLTNELRTAPVGGEEPEWGAWSENLKRTFGIKSQRITQSEAPAPVAAQPAPAPAAAHAKPAPAAAPKQSGLARQSPEQLAAPYAGTKFQDEMVAVQRALQAPNLKPEQRRALALQAQDIAQRYEKKYGNTKGYAAGGLVSGPGTTTSDSIPAVIDGREPAALSTGEAVLNAGALQLVGEDFIHRINAAGGLAPQQQPQG